MSWTVFWDMHSGGGQKLDFAKCFIEAPEAEAIEAFKRLFGRDPHNETCPCCGEDYSIDGEETLEEATAYHRNLDFAVSARWQNLPRSEWASIESRYLEPDEPLPDGWVVEFRRSGPKLTLDEYLASSDVRVVRCDELAGAR